MFFILLLTYILGGLTFIPLLIFTAIVYFDYTSELHRRPDLNPQHATPPSTTFDLKPPTLKSWITVRRTFEPTGSTSYISIVRTLLDSRSGSHRRADDTYYAVLKGSIIYLYEDEPMTECSAVIDIAKCTVTIYPSSNLLDGELFAKRNALLIKENTSDEEDSLLTSPWYMFFKSVSAMEDWYLALLAAQSSSSPVYPYASHATLIASLDALPDLIPTRWLNAILGRLFLAVKDTAAVEAWVVARLMKKLNKIKKPSFLTSVIVRSFEAGDVTPVFSKPMLKELTPEGEASVGVDVSYEAPPGGEVRITVSAIATFSLPSAPSLSLLGLGGGKSKEKDNQEKDKPYEVSLVLAVVLRRLSGNMLIKIKRPPSNRIWYCFTTMPQMEMTVEPLVSDRQIKWSMVLSVIESKLREVIQESVVSPYMDDIPFFDTSSFETRGGLFADAFKATSANYSEFAVSDASDTDSSKVLNDGLLAASLSDLDGSGSLGQAETTSHSVRKRKAWFGRKDLDIDDSHSDTANLTHKRVRSLDGSFPSPPTDISLVVTNADPTVAVESQEMQQPTRRAQSHNSRVVSETFINPSTSSSFDPIASSVGISRSAPSSSPISSSSAPSTPQPSSANAPSGSLFATLKYRGAVMAEKPKEAMKKWGVNVNWGTGLRKVDKEPETKTREKGKDDWELDTDHGDLWGNKDERKDASNTRTSFAELRRKVEAREKERASASTLVSTPASPPLISTSDNREQLRVTRSSGTKPIDIPGVSQTPTTSPSTAATTDTPRKSSPSSNTIPAAPAPFLSPSAPRTTTELHTSTHVVTPLRDQELNERQRRPSFVGIPESLPDVEAIPPVPIRAQPRAATMVIPSIHISHRNDVMALSSGPAASQPKANEFPAHMPLSTPSLGGIQSVRRLFRSNGSDVKDHEDKKGAGISTQSFADSISSPPPPPPPPPPPLPPRKQSAEIDRPQQSPCPTPKADTPPDSPASHALKQVVEQDVARKPPPLPARRNTPIIVPWTASSSAPTLVMNSALQGQPDMMTASPAGTVSATNEDAHDLESKSPPKDISGNFAKPPLPPRRPTFPPSLTEGSV